MNCRSNVLIGVKKDFHTGLSATYKNMEPQKVFLVMHNNVLYNNEIPLGERFIVINEGIKGVVVKNGEPGTNHSQSPSISLQPYLCLNSKQQNRFLALIYHQN